MQYNNRFFRTRNEAETFQAEHGGALYSHTPHSRTKKAFRREMLVAFDARQEIVNISETPWCVAWNE